MGLAWLTTLPAAALAGAVMWWIGHLIGGTPGAIAVFTLMVAAWLAMWLHSRRDPIGRHNVNDEWDPEAATDDLPAVPDEADDTAPISQGVTR